MFGGLDDTMRHRQSLAHEEDVKAPAHDTALERFLFELSQSGAARPGSMKLRRSIFSGLLTPASWRPYAPDPHCAVLH